MMKRLIFITMLLLSATVMKAEDVAQVIWCSDNTTLYFYYGELVSAGGTFKGQTVTQVWSGTDVTDSPKDDHYPMDDPKHQPPAWYQIVQKNAKYVVIDESFKSVKPTSGAWWFGYYAPMKVGETISTPLLSITGLEYLDTSEMTTMYSMFRYSRNLTGKLNLSTFKTDNCTDMSWMFSNCEGFTGYDLSSFNTSNVTTMECMFYRNSALTTLDLSNFNTKKVESMFEMFTLSSKLTTLTLSENFTAESDTSTYRMFDTCTSLKELDMSNFFNAPNLKNAEDMFFKCNALKTITIDPEKCNTSSLKNMQQMFDNCFVLEKVDLSGFDTENVYTMAQLFNECNALKEVNLTGLNTSNVTTMWQMFRRCYALTSLDLSSFNTEKVTTMKQMFSSLSVLYRLNLTSFNTKNVTDMADMFWDILNPKGNRVVYIGEGWNTTKIASNHNMKFKTTGGAGTVKEGDGLSIKTNGKADSPESAGMFTDRVYLFDNNNTKLANIFTAFKSNEVIPVPVRLHNRTLFKDGAWNTLCLPFSLTGTEIGNSVLAGAEIKELYNITIGGGKLYLHFREVNAITAGVPYIVKWTSGSDITNPDFNGVVINEDTPKTITVGSGSNQVKFIGTFQSVDLPANVKTNFFLTSDNTLKYPNTSYTVGGFRAYFNISEDLIAEAPMMVMSFDDDTTDIELVLSEPTSATTTSEDIIYDLQGRRVNNIGKGIYVVNGKKVVK